MHEKITCFHLKHPLFTQIANCRVLCSLLQKYSRSWRQVQPNVSWNCLATACAVKNIFLHLVFRWLALLHKLCKFPSYIRWSRGGIKLSNLCFAEFYTLQWRWFDLTYWLQLTAIQPFCKIFESDPLNSITATVAPVSWWKCAVYRAPRDYILS